MVAVSVGPNLAGLCRALVAQGMLSPEEGESMQNQARNAGDDFLSFLLRGRRFRADQIAAFASANFGVPYLNLDAMDPQWVPKGIIDPKLLVKYRALPVLQRGNKLFVAVSDPSNLKALDDIKFQTRLTVEPVVVDDDKLGKWLETYGESTEENILKTIDAGDINLEFSDDEAMDAQITAAAAEIDDAPVVKYLQKMMLDAINAGASDIHFEPYEKNYRIRYRLDGQLYEIAQPPLAIKEKIASRIKEIGRAHV
jgi:type IV pilus assembly protein PilB